MIEDNFLWFLHKIVKLWVLIRKAFLFANYHGMPTLIRHLETFPNIFQDGGTPLFVACQCNHLDVVQELLNRGADIHAQMVDGATPLFITAQNGHHELLKFLLKKGAEVDIKRKVSKVI